MANKADNQIKWVLNKMPKSDDKQVANMSLEEMSKANNFHKSFPQYSVTPLTGLPHLAEYLGLKKLYVKDESYRFGLNAFKVLGGSYAIARYMAQQLGKDVSEVPYDVLTSEKLKEDFGQATFFTATDGNHGRGVAWAANKLGQKCVVRMPKGTTQTRLNNIAKKMQQLLLRILTTMNVFVWLQRKRLRQNTASWFRIQPGKVMKKFLHGSCRVTAHSHLKLIIS